MQRARRLFFLVSIRKYGENSIICSIANASKKKKKKQQFLA